MDTDQPSPGGRSAAFGREFGSLMARLTEAFEALVTAERGAPGDRSLRRQVAVAFETEAENLIAKHGVVDPVAAYVRHVVREGFEVDFDFMDPTEDPLRSVSKTKGSAPRGPGRTTPEE